MKIISYPLDYKQWVATSVKKTHIVLHGSFSRSIRSPFQGNSRETQIIDTWNSSPEKYGCNYVIGLDGTVYQTFPEDEWAYHVNVHKKFFYDKNSVSVCFINELYLLKNSNNFYAFGIEKPHNLYQGEIYETKFKGYDYWAKLTEKQIEAGTTLVKDICDRQGISPVVCSNAAFNPQHWEHSTVLTHSVLNKDVYDFPLQTELINKFKTEGLKVV